MASVAMEKMHEWTDEDKDEGRIGKNMLPVVDQRNDHHDGEDSVEPTRDTKMFHELSLAKRIKRAVKLTAMTTGAKSESQFRFVG